MVKSRQITCQVVETLTPLVKEAQGPAASNFFNSPELVACVLESGVFTTDDLSRNQRINKFFNAAIKRNPNIQRIMKVRSMASNKIPTTHVERHNIITAHLAHFFFNAERFELRPFELVSEFTRLEEEEDVFTLSFYRNTIQSKMVRRGLPLGPKSSKPSSKSFDDHGKHIFMVTDRAKQSWEDILLFPFPIAFHIRLEKTFEAEVLCKRCEKHELKTRTRHLAWDFPKTAGFTLGDMVRLLELEMDGRKSYLPKKR